MKILKPYTIICHTSAFMLMVVTSCGLDDYTGIEGPFMSNGEQTAHEEQTAQPEEPEAEESDSGEMPEDIPSLYDFRLIFQLDGEQAPSRATNGNDGTKTGVIGTGRLIDHLIYAIYDAEDNILTQFAHEENAGLSLNGKTLTAGEGQNILKWEGETITVVLDSLSQGDYKIVCWAQSSRCDAYDTSDLSNVKVSYAGALNNDESRDAFCASESFTVSEENDDPLFNVILKRPFAQINVGTTGADYVNHDKLYGGVLYTYSSVAMKGVATSINVVDNIIGAPSGEEVLFAFAKLPAYNQMDVPSAKDELIQSPGETFLKIHLNSGVINDKDNDSFADYLTSYPTVEYGDDETTIKTYLSETFKYMSMCYALVPSTTTGATTLDHLKVLFADNAKGDNLKTSFSLTSVKTGRNMRTNIIGGLYAPPEDTPPDDPQDPNDPEGPDQPQPPVDDPTTIFSNITCNVIIITNYFNDHNLFYESIRPQN